MRLISMSAFYSHFSLNFVSSLINIVNIKYYDVLCLLCWLFIVLITHQISLYFYTIINIVNKQQNRPVRASS